MTHTLEKPSATSAGLMNASMLLYLFWLLLPAVQTTGRAVTGAAAVALFAVVCCWMGHGSGRTAGARCCARPAPR